MAAKSPTATWETTLTSVALFESVICLGCLFSTIYIQCTTPKRKHNGCTKISFCTDFGIVCFVMCSVSMAIFYWTYDPSEPPTLLSMIPYLFVKFGWNFGQFCSYFVFIFRVIDTFSNSALKIPRVSSICLVILLTLYESAWIVKCVAPLLFWLDFVHPHSHFFDTNLAKTIYYLTIPIFVFDLLITVSMTYMFISRLFMVMRLHTETIRGRQFRVEALHQSLHGDGQNRHLLDLSVKISVLSITSLLSTLIYVSLDAVVIFFDSDQFMAYILSICLEIDTIISCLCLTLFLARTERIYRILCCCCVGVQYRWMKQTLLKQVDQSTMSRTVTTFALSSTASHVYGPNDTSEPIMMKNKSDSIHAS